VRAQLTDQIKRTGDDNNFILTGDFDSVLEGLNWVSNDRRSLGRQVTGDFEQEGSRNCSRLSRLGDDYFAGVRK
jgi:hypothetical protein